MRRAGRLASSTALRTVRTVHEMIITRLEARHRLVQLCVSVGLRNEPLYGSGGSVANVLAEADHWRTGDPNVYCVPCDGVSASDELAECQWGTHVSCLEGVMERARTV